MDKWRFTTENEMLALRDQYEKYVNECKLETPEQVAELFRKYTALIWDFKLVGYCHKFYHESTKVHLVNGAENQGSGAAVSGTLGFQAAVPDLKFRFVDIFAEEDGKGGYKFAQAVYYDGNCSGYSNMGAPSYNDLADDNKYIYGLCWVDVRKLDGEWKQAEEWLIRDSLAMNEVQKRKEKQAEELVPTEEKNNDSI